MDARDLSSADDLRAAQDFTTRTWSPSSMWHAGGLAWDLGQHLARESGTATQRQTRLWRDADGVVAVADLVEATHLDVDIDPQRPELASEVITWFERTATRDELTISFKDGAGHIRDAVWSTGYLEGPDLPFGLDMRMAPETVAFVDLPDGYEVRSVDADWLEQRVEVHRAAWAPSRVTMQTYRNVMATWPYREVFDIIAVAPDGTAAACCIGWLDPTTHVAEIEPVGTHPDHRRKHLAQAVVAECIERLGVAGCEEVTIKPRGDDAYPVPRQVYAGMGFETVGRTRTFRKRRSSG